MLKMLREGIDITRDVIEAVDSHFENIYIGSILGTAELALEMVDVILILKEK